MDEYIETTRDLEQAAKKTSKNLTILIVIFSFVLAFTAYEGMTHNGWIGLVVALGVGIYMILESISLKSYEQQLQLNLSTANLHRLILAMWNTLPTK